MRKSNQFFTLGNDFNLHNLQMFNDHIMHTQQIVVHWTLNVIYVSDGYDNLHYSLELKIIIM